MAESTERTPPRKIPGRSGRNGRVVTSGIKWENPENVPGAILSPEAERRLQAKLRNIDECQRRAWVSARDYVIS